MVVPGSLLCMAAQLHNDARGSNKTATQHGGGQGRDGDLTVRWAYLPGLQRTAAAPTDAWSTSQGTRGRRALRVGPDGNPWQNIASSGPQTLLPASSASKKAQVGDFKP